MKTLQGEAELSQGLSVLILCVGIRPCASQIYPYVTKKLRVLSQPAGCDADTTKHTSVLAVTTGINYCIKGLFTALIEFGRV